jgi:hypothetical protein
LMIAVLGGFAALRLCRCRARPVRSRTTENAAAGRSSAGGMWAGRRASPATKTPRPVGGGSPAPSWPRRSDFTSRAPISCSRHTPSRLSRVERESIRGPVTDRETTG